MEHESATHNDNSPDCESKDIYQIIEEVFSRYTGGDYIQPSALPDLDLYVDQITTLLSRQLSKTLRSEDDKIMTKTMINNYTKNHLLPPPDKKKYSKDHILMLIFIYYFKNFLSISDIETLLHPISSQYFHKADQPNLESIYSTLFSRESTLVEDLLDNVKKEYEMSTGLFSDVPEEHEAYLQNFAFICILSLDIYIKKQLIESMIDQILPPKNA